MKINKLESKPKTLKGPSLLPGQVYQLDGYGGEYYIATHKQGVVNLSTGFHNPDPEGCEFIHCPRAELSL